MSAVDVAEVLKGVVPDELVRRGADSPDDLHHDEALGIEPVVPAAVVTPETEEQVAAVLAACDAHGIPSPPGDHGQGPLRPDDELGEVAKVALMRRIKAAFDPNGILNPGAVFGDGRRRSAGPDTVRRP